MTVTMVFCRVYLTMPPSLDKTQLEKHDLETKEICNSIKMLYFLQRIQLFCFYVNST